MERLRAIREYTTQHVCNQRPPHTTTWYVVTFAQRDGVVVADCSFSSKENAEFVITAVNDKYDRLGEPGNHGDTWLEDPPGASGE